MVWIAWNVSFRITRFWKNIYPYLVIFFTSIPSISCYFVIFFKLFSPKVLLGYRQCYKLLINYILRLHVKHFISASKIPLLYWYRLARIKFSHVITSACLSRMKKLINTATSKTWTRTMTPDSENLDPEKPGL